MSKLTILIAGAAGYVLGARAGRERYDEIKDLATKVRQNPTVQEKTQQAVDTAKAQAPVVKDKVADAAGTAKATAAAKVSGDGSSSDSADGDFPDESLINQENPYPQGDLP